MERISSFFLPLLSFSFASQLFFFFLPVFAKVERISFKCYNIIVIKKEKEKKEMKEIRITQEEEAEFIGQVVDVFEDFLESKGISIENKERDDNEEIAAIIYGADYDAIADGISSIVETWSEDHQ